MTHIWVRAEQRANETRVGLTPDGAATLLKAGFKVTVEASDTRAIATQGYIDAGCTIATEHSWPDAPHDAVIFGLKELPEDGTALPHCHIMFGHAYKGQSAGRTILQRFKAGGGTLLDLEYLTNDTGRRVAAFGYWAGFAGAAVTLKCWAAQPRVGRRTQGSWGTAKDGADHRRFGQGWHRGCRPVSRDGGDGHGMGHGRNKKRRSIS